MSTDMLDLLRELLDRPRETRNLEFKSARDAYSYDKTVEYCAALANEGGGHLVLGITDAMPREICGTNAFRNTEAIEARIHDKLRLRIVIEELTFNGQRVVIIKVGGRPLGQAIEVNGRYLMRQGEALVNMTADHLREIFTETREPFLTTTLINNLTADEVDQIIDTDHFFRLSLTEIPATTTQKCAILAANKLLLQTEDGSYGVTGLGGALFAHDMTITPELAARRLRFIQYSGRDRTDARRDVLTRRGYALEFESFLELVNASVPTDERIAAAHRQVTPTYAAVALRELLANAIVHQDFNAHPSLIAIEMYEDRLEVINPGHPLMDTRRFVEDTKSRNHDLAMMMRDLKMCEARGSGIQRALEANEESGAADPQFHAGDSLTRAVLIGKHDFTAMTLAERNWAIFMHACRMYASRASMSNQSFRRRYGLSNSKTSLVSIHIQQTIEKGLIKPQDDQSTSKRYARYHPFYA